MMTERLAVVPLRVFLVVLFGVLVVFQTLSLPGQFAYMARESPDLAYLRWPLTAVSVFWVLCVQVVIVCTWRLLTLVTDEALAADGVGGMLDRLCACTAEHFEVLHSTFQVEPESHREHEDLGETH